MENKEFVKSELEFYIASLTEYRDAIEDDDLDRLIRLLDEGKRRKEQVDG